MKEFSKACIYCGQRRIYFSGERLLPVGCSEKERWNGKRRNLHLNIFFKEWVDKFSHLSILFLLKEEKILRDKLLAIGHSYIDICSGEIISIFFFLFPSKCTWLSERWYCNNWSKERFSWADTQPKYRRKSRRDQRRYVDEHVKARACDPPCLVWQSHRRGFTSAISDDG